MKKYLIILLAACLIIQNISIAQDSKQPLMHINGKPTFSDEFIRIYKKNNPTSEPLIEADVKEYLELFIKFKLKVSEAVALGLDTAQSFKTELQDYRAQLAKTYLMDRNVDNELIHEAYDRMKWDVNASHILINIADEKSPADTLFSYNKINDLRNRILQGESFERLARQFSNDPSAIKNDGKLGYFTGFQMVYPFENAAFNTPVGEISEIIRTRFGYHIIQVNDKRPAVGSVKVAHIMIASKGSEESEEDQAALSKINNIYEQILQGEEFSVLAEKYSDDKGSAMKGGELPEFGTGRMIPEFEKVAFQLTEPSSISKPFRTSYGYHIVKLISRSELGTFEELQNELKSKIQRDERSSKSKEVFLKQLKEEYQFQEYSKTFEAYLASVPDSAPGESWEASEVAGREQTLFILHGKNFTEREFTSYLLDGRTRKVKVINKNFIISEYNNWIEKEILAYEDARLEMKHPEFKHLMQEYHDGILLFELSDQKVWSKAINDSLGLQQFYNENKNNYQWNDRLDCSVYTLTNRKDTPRTSEEEVGENNAKALKKIKKLAKKRAKKDWSKDEFLIRSNKILTKAGSSYNVNVNDRKAEKGSWHLLNELKWKKGISPEFNEAGEILFVVVKDIIPAQPKALNEIKGIVTADYQNYLEKQWIQELRNKYEISINEKILQQLFE